MTAKSFFLSVRRAEAELKVLNAKLAHYEDLGMSISSGNSGGLGHQHRATSRVELAACGAVDALRDLDRQKREFMAIIARAEQVIRNIPQERYRDILNYHYLCGWSFRSISDELRYNDPNSVYRAHGWALVEAQKVIDAQEKQTGTQE